MSSLQCAARIFVAGNGTAEEARGLAERLRGERIVRVWTGPPAGAVATAEVAAEALGVDVVVVDGLREFALLDEIADAHPGEATLVITEDGPAPPAYLAFEADADGWRLAWDPDHT
jgi:hypothetical protein